MKRLLLDQGLPRSTASLLRERGWDARHVGELGMSQAEDAAILEFARQEKLVVVTLDADFHALLALSGAAHPSVIRIRQEGLKGEHVATLIENIFSCSGTSLETGAMITATTETLRVKRLPIAKG